MNNMVIGWQAVDGDVLLRADDVDWWGASLSILVAAFHHPDVLLAQQPGTDAATVAREVLAELDELERAAEVMQGRATAAGVTMTLEGDYVRLSPGSELGMLVTCLDTFARAVLDPAGAEAETARGPLAYTAGAWSRDLGTTPGAL
jgi:hypothetical protein